MPRCAESTVGELGPGSCLEHKGTPPTRSGGGGVGRGSGRGVTASAPASPSLPIPTAARTFSKNKG